MNDARATSFGAAADHYEAARPEYPFEAVAWMLENLPHGSCRIADVGAGTGKLTRVLISAPDAEVVAIDPDPAMLAKLRESVPGVPTFTGTAEHLPLPDSALDAVVLGQAWHWVDPVPASAEIGRVVRPGGTLGLIWNIRDESEEWVRRLTEIMHSSSAENMVNGPTSRGPQIAGPFGRIEVERWEWVRPMTREQVHRMADSRSHLITASDAERHGIHDDMDTLFDTIGMYGDATIDLPYVTTAFRAVRAD
ncbi:class I SAM-dependent methyltransferase [Microbacterium sp. TWP3-1-2b2]|uniref:class I SAM-dependent methyltransferase n=1 Tax=Microbacterium sp. TWP3-1-2b2 TaxID=2804651 RepID=UPI003CFB84E9